jgi:hypothetical protein
MNQVEYAEQDMLINMAVLLVLCQWLCCPFFSFVRVVYPDYERGRGSIYFLIVSGEKGVYILSDCEWGEGGIYTFLLFGI